MSWRLWHFGAAVEELRAHLAQGGLLALPTESTYALAADPRDARAVSALYRLKGRAANKPLPVVIGDLAQLDLLGIPRDLPAVAAVAQLWPAALSVVLPLRAPLPASAGTPTLAVRIPDHPALCQLLRALGSPLTATSANPAGEPPMLSLTELLPWLAAARAEVIVVDGGDLPGGPPSTLVAWRNDEFAVLRPGRFPLASLPQQPLEIAPAASPPATDNATYATPSAKDSSMHQSGVARSVARAVLLAALTCGGWLGAPQVLAPQVLARSDQPPAVDAATSSPGDTHELPIITVDEVRPGQKGYGLSVFAGSVPERFEVEVIGVWRNPVPELSYILTRLSGMGLERSGVIAGMSGSPVYFDGRLAGAVSFGYAFGLDPIAGIMPIQAMRKLAHLPAAEPPSSSALAAAGLNAAGTLTGLNGLNAAGTLTGLNGLNAAGTSLTLRDLLPKAQSDERLHQMLTQALARLSPVAGAGGRPALLYGASGFGEAARDLLTQTLGPLAPMGRLPASQLAAGSGAPSSELVPGGAVAAVLVEGDLSLAIYGTITDRSGDGILAFGHPLFATGPVAMPMGSAEVITVINNQSNSFKLTNAGPIVGAFDQDRQAGVHGQLGRLAPTFPLAVRLSGLTAAEYHVRVAAMPDLWPSLLAITVLGGINSATYSTGAQGLDLEARFTLANHDDLTLNQSLDGNQAVLQGVVFLLSVAQLLAQNSFAELTVDAIDVAVTQAAVPRTAALLEARAARTRVAPGDRVPITLEIQPHRGTKTRHTFEFQVPERIPDGPLILLVGDGVSMDEARLTLAPQPTDTLAQTLRQLQSLNSRRELQVVAIRQGAGLVLASSTLPQLPPSMQALLNSGGSPAGTPLTLQIVAEQTRHEPRPVEGLLRVDLEVKRRPD